MTFREVAAPPARFLAGRAVRLRTRSWPPHTRLFAVGERTGWSVDEDARHLEETARRLGYEVAPSRWARFANDQAVFLASHFEALQPRWLGSSHRLSTAYLHGRPGTPGSPEFDRAYEGLRASPGRFARIQVTHREMRDLVLQAGVDQAAVHVIPIGIDLEHFPLVEPGSRRRAREELGIPDSAFVVGSFQKDGVGWEDGLEPKLFKGPDVLVAALERIKEDVPELFVLLTGRARGYVRSELDRLAVPSRHVLMDDRAGLGRAYHALDVYVVPSRQEGGPKAVLESMASGIPLVTTRVGQAQEIVEHGRNGWLVDVEDVASLAESVIGVRDGGESVTAAGRETAEAYAYERLDPLWNDFLQGYVEAAER